LYGFKAIAAANGWAMALAGALIVLSGLAVLSFIISQLKNVVEFMELRTARRKGKAQGDIDDQPLPSEEAVDQTSHLDPQVAAAVYRPLTETLDQPFRLRDLYDISRQNDLPHPHLTIRSLCAAGLLVPQGDGLFTWN